MAIRNSEWNIHSAPSGGHKYVTTKTKGPCDDRTAVSSGSHVILKKPTEKKK